jgi:hypothetical protein
VFTGAMRWLAATLAAFTIGEAVALLLGTLPRRGGRNPWATPAHVGFLLVDLVTGCAIVWFGIVPAAPLSVPALAAALGVLAATHAWRAYEYLAHRPDPFCANPQLFSVDVGKLAGGVLVLVGWWLTK